MSVFPFKKTNQSGDEPCGRENDGNDRNEGALPIPSVHQKRVPRNDKQL